MDTPRKVLIADDEPDILEILKYNLVNEGYQVFTAKDGDEALDKAKLTQPDLVILDIMMPKINGLDVLKKLREQDETQNIPVIVLTALIQDREKMESITRGADDYIVKSETMPGDVIQKIHRVLEKRATAAEQPKPAQPKE